MNFFAHQAAARAKTRRMVWLFVLAILVVVVAIDLVVLLVFGIAVVPDPDTLSSRPKAPHQDCS